jgi:hypothetical protein
MKSDVPYYTEEPVGRDMQRKGCLVCTGLFVTHQINNQNSIREG